MKKTLFIVSILLLVAFVYSCNKTVNTPHSSVSLELPATPYPYFSANDSNLNQKATLGRVLFYDSHLSLNNAISCGSCHKQDLGFADNKPFSTGYQGMLTKRNSKSLSNIEGDNTLTLSNATLSLFCSQPVATLFWDGRENVLRNLIARPLTNHVEMGIENADALAAKLANLSYYSPLFTSAYGDSAVTLTRLSECIAYFILSIQSHNSRFDQYTQQGNMSSLSALEQEGMGLFITKYNCASCHHIFTNSYSPDEAFKDIGLDASYTDMGRGTISGNATDKGKFRVPNLRNVALSAPYMHDGRYATLSDVIDHYSHNIQNSPNLDRQLTDTTTGHAMQMNISDQEKTAIIAFLGTLTDYQMVTDPKFSNPFKIK